MNPAGVFKRKKLQIPSSNIQRRSKSQRPIPINGRPPGSLVFGIRPKLNVEAWSLKLPTGFSNIARDLGFQFLKGGELLLVAQPCGERDFQFLTLKLAFEIKEVNLHAKLRHGLTDRWPMADVQHSAMGLVTNGCMRSIDSFRWQNESIEIKVGSGETKCVSKFVSSDDPGSERVRTPQHLTGGVEIAPSHCLPDTSAADHLTIQRNGRDPVDNKLQFATKLFQYRDIAAAFVAENEVGTNTNALNSAQFLGELTYERFTRQLAEQTVKAKYQQSIRSERLDGAHFLRLRINQRRDAVGGNNRTRVLVEGDDQCDSVLLACIGNGLPYDLLMAEMHAVEHTNGETDLLAVRLEFS
jgi:hypothetical protein